MINETSAFAADGYHKIIFVTTSRILVSASNQHLSEVCPFFLQVVQETMAFVGLAVPSVIVSRKALDLQTCGLFFVLTVK
jgi:hypothetical protein